MSSINIQDFLNRAWRRSSSSQSRPSQGAAGASAGTTAGPSSATSTTVAPASSLQHHGILCPRQRFPLIPSHDSVGQDAAVEKVCGFLKSAQVRIVGIYGMGGVGKTTLMKMVHNKFLVGCDFDLILWVVVSKEWNYDKTRKLIIRRLGVGPFDPDADVVAMELFNFLRDKRFVLLLDDVWEHLDLMELGVPNPTENDNMSKIIFTTRSEEVCRQMRTDREIKIDCLGPTDSWALFEKNVGDKALNSHPRVHSLAHQIVKECCGLPLALIIVGRAMSSKYAPEEWKHALEVLENHPYQMPGVVNKLFSCLELSYLSLGEGTLQKCFLYCSLFPEDLSIQKKKLVDYWIGEGFLGECENLEQLRNRGYHIIGVLLAACLIENGTHEEDKGVKMHDVIRDMALWIVSDHGAKQNRFFVHPGHRLTSSEIHVRWSMAERIFVQDFKELPKLPSCPALTTLIFDKDAQLAFKRSWYKNLENDRAKVLGIGEMQIKGKEPLSDPEPDPVPSSSNAIEMPLVDDPMSSLFQFMPSLRLLELSFCLMSDLPKAVMELPKLRYLSSAGVKYLSPKVGKLSSLEILDMSCLIKPTADINSPLLVDLPDTIAQLSELRLLNLKGMWLKSLPEEIGRLSKLEILDLSNAPIFFLPTGISGLRELRQLKLSGTMLHSLPEEVVYLSKLEILDLSKTKITDLPWRIYWLGKLRQLNLENTWLVELPKEMFYLSKLEMLNLSKSRIRELPNMIRRLSELRQLDLEDTLLKTLPKEMGFLPKLEILNLSGSARIVKHSSGIEELCELRQLNLKGTHFLEWSVDMSKLTKLEILDLSFTFIAILPSTISWLVELRQLNLEGTFICRLEEAVRNLSKLEILNLNRTLIMELPTWITRLHQLRELYLDKTLLKTLPNEVGDLTKLEILSLSGTYIEEIPSWIDQLPELKELNLTGTPWHQVNLRRSVELPSMAARPGYHHFILN